MTLRIAIGGFIQETMLRSPVPTDATTVNVYRAAEIYGVDNWPAIHGAIERLREEPDVEIVPLLFARAASGGAVARDFYESIRDELVARIEAAGPLDGMVVVNHGALEVEGYDVHGDTDFVLAIRRAIGDAPLGVPFDMHGQVTPELIGAIQALAVLRTAPHRDIYDIGRRVTAHLMDVVRGRTSPVIVGVHIPMFIPGEKAMSAYAPAGDLFGMMPAIAARPGMIEAEMFIGFGWNDRPWVGMKAVAVSDGDPALARAAALEIARTVWQRRHEFQLRMEHYPVAEGLRVAAASTVRPTYVSDSGDNVSAGAGGDLTDVLKAVLDTPDLDDAVVLGILAPGIVAACRAAGPGASVTLDLGAEHLTGTRDIRRVEAVVEATGDSLTLADNATRTTTMRGSRGAWARVRIDSTLATFHAVRGYFGAPEVLQAMGIDPVAHKVYIVKFGYLLPATEDVAARHILLESGGAADMRFALLDWIRIARPAFPMDLDMEWTPEGAVFTGIPA